MQDIRAMRENFDELKDLIARRGKDIDMDGFRTLDTERRALMARVEDKRAAQNAASKQMPLMKKAGEDTTAIISEMKQLAEDLKTLEPQLKSMDDALHALLMGIPNAPHPTVPPGTSEADNVEVRRWGTPPTFSFEPQAHWDIGEKLGIFDPTTAAKITGTRFVMLRGLGARLERALVAFMLDRHTAHGYQEISPPYIAHRRSMEGVGQLPDKEGQLFHLSDTDYFLIPTAETPLTNIHREEILDGARLPVKYCAFSYSFRKEAGAAGRDTRGLIRMHQFPKVEIFKLARPEDSYAELESLTADAEDILQQLGIPYNVTKQCAGDLGFANAMTYDLNVWMPSYGKYVEVSSCSNFEAFQARRAGIRFRDDGGKPQFTHTLNGSGLGVNRTIAAIWENFQQADGSVKIPEILWPYMGGVQEIK